MQRRFCLFALAATLIVPTTRAADYDLTITADNSIVDNSGERSVNMGASSTIRLKVFQHHLIVKADTSPIAGQKVVAATLKYRRNSEQLQHVTVSSIQGDWVEGTSGGFATENGSSCFLAAQYHSDVQSLVPWSFPGSRFVDVTYGNGFSLLNYSDCVENAGYYEWTVDPDIVNALAMGVSYGIAVYESSDIVSRNPTVHSREASGDPPVLSVTTEAADPAPAAVTDLTFSTDGVDRGEARLSWTAPGGALAYQVTIQGGAFASATALPRYLIPFAAAAGETQQLLLRDIVEPETSYTVVVTALARGGAASPEQTLQLTTKGGEAFPFANRSIGLPAGAGFGYSSHGLRLFAVPVTDKVLPDGQLLETVAAEYPNQNPVFDGVSINLRGGRNDMLAFQLVLLAGGPAVTGISVTPAVGTFDIAQNRVGFINTDNGVMPELLLESAQTYATNMDSNASEQTAQSLLVEIFVPQNATVGEHSGEVVVAWEGHGVTIPISVQVDALVIPDAPTFKNEMNDYGYPSYMATFNALQTTARRFRSHVNLVPYSQSGRTRMDLYYTGGGQMDEGAYNNISSGDTAGHWSDFSSGFGPAFDATLYQGGPWDTAPLPGFYLTFHESWPLLAKDFYSAGTRDAYSAFPVTYGDTFKAVLADFIQHAKGNNWQGAGFQVYLNNKPSSSDDPFTIVNGSTPWTLDEPYDFWDFRALKYYGELFAQGAAGHDPIDIKYRIDISRYPYHRGQLDGLVDLAVVSRSMYVFPRLIFDLAAKDDIEIWNYGTANPVWDSNVNAAGWVLSCYAMGCRGILPWSSLKYGSDYLSGVTGNDRQQRALFVVTSDSQTPQVYPSLRLAAFRRAALDVEYLEILRNLGGYSQGQLQRLIRNYLELEAAFSISGAYEEDAGTISFADLTSTQLWQLRKHVLDSIADLMGQPMPDAGAVDGALLVDAGGDAGGDAGVLVDAAVADSRQPDTWMVVDNGPAADSAAFDGAVVDTWTSVDSRTVDGAAVDAAGSDSTLSDTSGLDLVGPDTAAPPQDASATSRDSSKQATEIGQGGCSCDLAPARPSVWLLGAVVLLLIRRFSP